MANKTDIEWTDFSCQLIRYRNADGKDVWACVKCSSGCAGCYSEAIAMRFNRGGPFTLAGMRGVTPYFAEDEAKKVVRSKQLSGRRVFVGDMTDVFGEWVPDDLLDLMFAVFALRPDVTFQVLTKRPERMARYFNERDSHLAMTRQFVNFREYAQPVGPWPLPNVHLGTSVENQATADERIPHLLRVPAAVRFLSVEPLLGPVNLRTGVYAYGEATRGTTLDGIAWCICGGESGTGARPMHPDWARSVRDQCVASGTPYFFKQHGEWIAQGQLHDSLQCSLAEAFKRTSRALFPDGRHLPNLEGRGSNGEGAIKIWRVGKKVAGRVLDGREWNEFPVPLEVAPR